MAIGGNHPVDEFPLKDPLSSDLAEYVSRNPGAHVIAISTSLERDRFELSDDQAHCVEFTGHLVGEGQCDLGGRSEEHTSKLQSLMRISYAVFCLKKKNRTEFNRRQNDKKYQIH